MIEHGMTWKSIPLCSHGIHVYMGLTFALSHGFTCKPSLLEIQMKCKSKKRLNKIINFVDLITFQVLVGFS